MNQTIAIHENKRSEKVIVNCTGVYELMRYCSERQAKKLAKAANAGRLFGAYFTKSGNVRATYNH